MQFILQLLIFAGVFDNYSVYKQDSISDLNKTTYFHAPLDIPLVLAGNYGEIRSAHFHGGIDIKTQQVEGKAVLAADSGYVFRVAVQSGGYGHAIYLRHPGGLVTVYGHLRQFASPVEAWVKSQQYRKKSFEVDLNPDEKQFIFRKGETIGHSGNTGSSGGPHLHFEIRDKSAAIPLNGLKYSFPIKDLIKPKIEWLCIYPLDDSSSVNGINRKLLLPVFALKNNLYIKANNPSVSGNIGFGIVTYDLLNNALNKCEPYSMSLYEDSILHFRCVIDSIPFFQTGYVASHIDYEEKIRSGRVIQKMFVDPNNNLPIYKKTINRGIIQFSDSLEHNIVISVADAYDNRSDLNFRVHSTGDKGPVASLPKDTNIVARFYYDSLNVFETPEVRVVVPKDGLYENIKFHFAKAETDSGKYSAIFSVDREETPLKKPFVLSIKPRNLPPYLRSKAGITGIGTKGNPISQGGSYKNGFVTAQVKSFGRFFVSIDTLAPTIKASGFRKGAKYSDGQVLSFRIRDAGSGISKYSGYIDQEWALFEYDGKNELLFYRIDDKKIQKGKTHTLEIIVSDNRENFTRFESTFYF
jgi:murein DD-endopeptidase MepM/ murein hydrolase activator NlpD